MPPKRKTDDRVWRGRRMNEWFDNTTVQRIKDAFKAWGDDEYTPKPVSKAKKLDWWNALIASVGPAELPGSPSNYQLRRVLDGDGVVDLNPTGPPTRKPTTTQPKPPKTTNASSTQEPKQPQTKPNHPNLPTPSLTPVEPKDKPNTSTAKPTSSNVQESGILKAFKLAPGAPGPRPVFQEDALYVDDDTLVSYESLFDDKTAPNIRSIKVLFFVTQATSRDPDESNLVGDAFDPIRGYTDNKFYKVSAVGKYFPYRGRGPIWADNSGALDCVIVAARLLSVGTTAWDTNNKGYRQWLKTLSKFQETCVETFHGAWDAWTPKTNSQMKNRLLIPAYDELSASTEVPGFFSSALSLWAMCTSMSQQFKFNIRRESACRSCSAYSQRKLSNQGGLVVRISKDHENNNITMQDLLQRRFGKAPKPEYKDHTCGGKACYESRETIVGDPPPRLVVVPVHNDPVYIRGTTDDYITFSYVSSIDDTEKIVAYRWLGGIYHKEGHFRLYWTDCNVGDNRGHIMVYDGKLCGAAIIGGLPPHHPEYKVPTWWATKPVVLFYERIPVDEKKRIQSVAPPRGEFPKKKKTTKTTTRKPKTPTPGAEKVNVKPPGKDTIIVASPNTKRGTKVTKTTIKNTTTVEKPPKKTQTPVPKSGTKKRARNGEDETSTPATKKTKADKGTKRKGWTAINTPVEEEEEEEDDPL